MYYVGCVQKEDECERSERRRTRSSELISEDGKQPQRTTGELMSEDDSPLSRRETRSRTLSTDTPTNDAGSKLVGNSSEIYNSFDLSFLSELLLQCK